MEGVCDLLTVMLQQMNPGKSEEDIAALVQAVRKSPSDASSRPRNTPHSSESTHFPPNDEVILMGTLESVVTDTKNSYVFKRGNRMINRYTLKRGYCSL
ncbi:hypothetical protein PIB30_022759 [Stylosanthes scabra]|uniref:Uncharacterized protein n=1 Tax=Stylosanthes scabra TaxID=79078 RepID=A0ABU6R9R8_9FABA|nr:hypothetical protein [Stylosanthes scabra]